LVNFLKTVGVLALQGDFEAHSKAVMRAADQLDLQVRVTEVRTTQQLAECDGLIIPGGESTTMLKLLDIEGLTEPIKQFAASKPVYGSCAGAILLAKEVTHPAQVSLALMDIAVERNAYGRQIDSRIVRISGEGGEMEAVFIRAPIIRKTGSKVQVLASYQTDPVWVEEGRHMVTTFHPELSGDTQVHERFLRKI
jgi:pyridoxal 5'-phosphate synthase pdxT subunit